VGDFNLVIKMARCESGKDKDCTGEATHTVQNEETEMRCCGPCADHAPGNATVETISKAFTISWAVVKNDVCEHCAGWGDHDKCDCEYDPDEVHRGGQCVYCDSGDECKASESGLKCPYVKKSSKAFTTGWSILKKFDPEDDTCIRCGGQKTPERYGPDGPPNGNCSCNE